MHEALLGFDRGVGEILTALEDTNRLENTIVVLLSDNGYMWEEHRLSLRPVLEGTADAVRQTLLLEHAQAAEGGSSAPELLRDSNSAGALRALRTRVRGVLPLRQRSVGAPQPGRPTGSSGSRREPSASRSAGVSSRASWFLLVKP